MSDYCGRFALREDMNGDLVFSISDVWLWVKALWLLPAKLAAWAMQSEPGVARFFEIDCHTGEGSGGAVFSLVCWGIVASLLSAVFSEEAMERRMRRRNARLREKLGYRRPPED